MDWPDSRGRNAWWLVAILFGATLAWVVFNYIGTFVLGLFLYYVTRPAHRRLRSRFRPSLAAAIALFALAVPVVLLVGYTLLVAGQELSRLEQTVDLGPLAGRLEPYLDISELVQDPQVLLQNPDLVNAGQLLAEGALAYVPIVGSALINLFLALVVAFYLLKDGPRLSRWTRTTFSDDKGLLDVYVDSVDKDLGSVFFGNILNAFFTAVVAAFVYTVLNAVAPAQGIPYPALLAVLAGAASLIPVVGMKLVYIPVSVGLFARAVLSGEPLWFPVVFVVVTVVLVDFIPDLVLRPYVSGRNLHVGLVMIAYIIGPLLFGWYGLFLGPLVLVVVYHFTRLVLPILIDRDRTVPAPQSADDIDADESVPDGPDDVDSGPDSPDDVDSDPA